MSKQTEKCNCGCEPKDQTEWCDKTPPALRLFASVGTTSHCCIARGKEETDFVADAGQHADAQASGLQVALGGLGIATGKVSADAGGGQTVTYRVLYMADNVIQTTTFRACWWTCGGYPGKRVSLTVREVFPSNNDVALSTPLATYPCLPPESACDDCCCLTFTIRSCHTCDELRASPPPQRKLEFAFTATDGCGNTAQCVVPVQEP